MGGHACVIVAGRGDMGLRWRDGAWTAVGSALGLGLLPGMVFAQAVAAQRPFGRYQQFVWQEQQGLPQDSVRAITRTRDGYLWLATYAGAARLDGVRFTVFDRANIPQLASGLVLALLEDHAGRLWIGTDGDGLVSYSDGKFTSYTARDGLTNTHVMALLEDRAGTLWIGTDGGGVHRVTQGRLTPFAAAGLPSMHVSSLAEDVDGALWVGTTAGLARCERERCTVVTTREGLAHDSVRALGWDRERGLWIGTVRGVSRFANGRFTTYGDHDGLPPQTVNVVYADREGTVWIGGDEGLYRFRGGRFEGYAVRDGVTANAVLSIYQDPEGDLWIGTSNTGLIQFRDPRFRTFTPKEGLAGWSPVAVSANAAGDLWTVSEGGLSHFVDGAFVTEPSTRGFADARMRAIARDPAGNVWVGSRVGLFRVSREGLTHWTTAEGLAHDQVFAILPDRQGHVWVGTLGGGLSVLRDDHFTTYTTRDGLPDNDVLRLFEDRAGAIWIGTRSGGVSRFANGRFTNWSTQQGLGNNHVLAFHEDRNGHLWVATHGGGLSRLKDGRIRTVTSRDGLADNLAYQILEDDRGNAWMSSGRGIYRASLQELNDFADGRITAVSSFAYGVGDGMLNRDCSGGSPGGAKMPDGTLWFATARGLVMVDPSRQDTQPPLVAIETISIDRQPVAPGAAVRIEPGQRDLEIAYTALSWRRARHVKFKYRLAGLDTAWIDAGERRSATYSHLPAGTYTFTVIADNGDGVWNHQGRSVTVIAVPAFYQTAWFIAASTLSVAGAIAWGWRARVRQLERAHASQQAFSRELIASQERERQRIAAELHDSLGQHLLVIQNQAMLHAARPPATDVDRAFAGIGGLVSDTIDEVRAISWNLRPSHLDQLGLRTALIVITEKMSAVGPLSIAHAIDPCDGLLPPEQEILVYRIVQEALNNVVKHAHATDASVTIRRLEQSLVIEVRDDGAGFVVQARPDVRHEAGGFGLAGIAERVHMLGGTLAIRSVPGEGTAVTVTVDRRPSTRTRHA